MGAGGVTGAVVVMGAAGFLGSYRSLRSPDSLLVKVRVWVEVQDQRDVCELGEVLSDIGPNLTHFIDK